MNNMPFSVLMSVYYKESPEYLGEALESVFKNTVQPNEIVLVKDGPLTPDLDRVIQTYQQRYNNFKIIENKTNMGLGVSLSIGLLACTNELVARMDSDDISKPYRFERQLAVMEKGYSLVSCWSEFFENDINNVIAIKKRPETHELIVRLSKRRSPVSHAASMFRKSDVLKAGNYQHCLFCEDYYLWLRMIKSGAIFYNIQDYLYSIRTSNEQFGRRGGWKYLKTELKSLYRFYKEGYHSGFDFLVNVLVRISTRMLPLKLRRRFYLLMWKFLTK